MANLYECICEERDGRLILSNSKIEIQVDRRSGAISGLLNKTSGVETLGRGTPEVFRVVHCSWPVHGAKPGDPWSAVYGTVINSSSQQVMATHFEQTPGGARLEIQYEPLRLERRTIAVRLRYTIELRDGDEETFWKIFIQNDDPGTLREVHFPFLAGLQRLDGLIMPSQGGQKLSDPLEKLSDEVPQVVLEYPARASMQWFEYFTAHAGVYLASYDQDLSYTRLCFGRPEGRTDAAMWIAKYPFATQAAQWESPTLAVGIHAGDWLWGADRYREWARSWMVQPDVPARVREMTSGSDEFYIKDNHEKLVHPYEDIPRITARKPAENARRFYMLVGWFYNGHDTFFPEYKPIPDLGGEKALVAAIDQAHAQGAAITAYQNSRLANVETETYRRHGKQWAVLTKAQGLGGPEIEFGELHENWNRSWERDQRGEGWFVVLCPAVKERQDQLVAECVRAIQTYHFDGLFLDQPGSYYAELCYNKHHGHANPAAAWGPGYLELFRRIRAATRQVNPECVLFTEGMNDAYGQYLDYHMDKNPVWAPMSIHPDAETFVEMWRYTFPEYVTINSPWGYSYPPSHDRVYGGNYFFILGIRWQLSLDDQFAWEKLASDEDRRSQAAVLAKVEALWARGDKTLFYDRFMDDIGLVDLDPQLLAKVYLGNKRVTVPVWNTGEKQEVFTLSLDLSALGLTCETVEVHTLDSEKPANFTYIQSTVTVRVDLPAHAIDAVVVKALDLP